MRMPRDWMYTKDGDYGDGVAMFAARRQFAGSLPLPDGRPRSFAESFEWSAAASAECSHGKFGGAQLHGGAPKNQGNSAPLGRKRADQPGVFGAGPLEQAPVLGTRGVADLRVAQATLFG